MQRYRYLSADDCNQHFRQHIPILFSYEIRTGYLVVTSEN